LAAEGFLAAVVRFAAVVFFDAAAAFVVRVELRGDLAADVFVERPAELLVELVPAVREVLPLVDVFDRADVVPRDEDVLELPPFDELLLDEPPREPAVFPRDDVPAVRDELPVRAELPVREVLPVREEALRPLDVALLRAVDPPRADVPELRAPVELFFAVEVPPAAERLRFVAAAPFLPAALFLAAVVLRVDVEREPPVDDFFAPPAEARELVPADFLAEPPAVERADVERVELELFFVLPPLLLEPDDEREPDDFLVVAMRIIPPMFWYIPACCAFSNTRAR
jgi:hypothetical protein